MVVESPLNSGCVKSVAAIKTGPLPRTRFMKMSFTSTQRDDPNHDPVPGVQRAIGDLDFVGVGLLAQVLIGREGGVSVLDLRDVPLVLEDGLLGASHQSTCTGMILEVSLPKMSMTFTITLYVPGES